MKIWKDNLVTICSTASDFLAPITKSDQDDKAPSQINWRLDVFGRPESFGGVLIHHRSGREALVDAQGFKIYKAVRQNPNTVKSKNVLDYIDVLGSYLRGYPIANQKINRWFQPLNNSSILSSPLYLRWEITKDCNLACKHCYTEYSKDMTELDTTQALRLIEKFKELKIYQLRFGGGEPFIRKDFLTILRYAQDCDLHPSVVTNATLIDRTTAKKISAIGLKDIFVSLDGATAKTHDTFRGCIGSWNLAIQGIEALQKEGLDICIQSMVHEENLDELDDLIDLALSLQAKAIVFKLPIISGKARLNAPLQNEQIYKAAAVIKAHKISKARNIHINDLELICHSPCKNQIIPYRNINCGPGYRTCTLRPDGRLVPCHYLQNQQWQTETVSPDNFQHLWQTEAPFEHFRRLNSHDLKECQTCSKFLKSCLGGCRARAWLATDNFKGKDPECLDKKAVPALNAINIPLFLSYFQPSKEWLWRDINGSIILYSPREDRYLKLTKLSSFVWKILADVEYKYDYLKNIDYQNSIKELENIIKILYKYHLLESTREYGMKI